MKAIVDQELCIGCGLCCDICPEVFHMNDDGLAESVGEVPEGQEEKVREAAESCPVDAIKLE